MHGIVLVIVIVTIPILILARKPISIVLLPRLASDSLTDTRHRTSQHHGRTILADPTINLYTRSQVSPFLPLCPTVPVLCSPIANVCLPCVGHNAAPILASRSFARIFDISLRPVLSRRPM